MKTGKLGLQKGGKHQRIRWGWTQCVCVWVCVDFKKEFFQTALAQGWKKGDKMWGFLKGEDSSWQGACIEQFLPRLQHFTVILFAFQQIIVNNTRTRAHTSHSVRKKRSRLLCSSVRLYSCHATLVTLSQACWDEAIVQQTGTLVQKFRQKLCSSVSMRREHARFQHFWLFS